MGRNVIITLRVSPEDVDIDLDKILPDVVKIIEEFGGTIVSATKEDFVFGLKILNIKFLYPDQEFYEEELISKIASIKGISNAEVVSVSLAQ